MEIMEDFCVSHHYTQRDLLLLLLLLLRRRRLRRSLRDRLLGVLLNISANNVGENIIEIYYII